jgi:hypothetical protein
MKHLKIAGLLLASLFALGLMTTSAFALPDLGLLSGENFPGEAKARSTATVALENSGGSVLTGTGVETKLVWASLSALGVYTSEFKSVGKGTIKCETTGAGAGNVLVGGEVHLVFTSTSPLTVAMLLLVPEITLECAGLDIKVRGAVLGTYGSALNADLTTFTGELKGSLGVQNLTKYFNNGGTVVEASLLSSVEGGAFKKSSLNIAAAQEFKVEGGKMIIVTG